MKNKYLLRFAAVLFMLTVGLASCTDNFEDENTNPMGVSQEALKADNNYIGGYFPQISQLIFAQHGSVGVNWTYQIFQNLNADIFSGYMMTGTPFADNVNNTTYSLVDGWNSFAWNTTYQNLIPAINSVQEVGKSRPEFYAIARIFKVLAISRISDLYGPCIYTKLGQSKTGAPYDDMPTLYNAFFSDLNASISELKTILAANPGLATFKNFDQIFDGDLGKWIKFANSLKLRLALRIVKANPDLSKKMVEEAVAGGLMLNGTAQVRSAKGTSSWSNPISAISNSWGDIGMSAVMESILTGYQDPRLELFFSPTNDATATAVGKKYEGIRQGIALAKDQYKGYSKVNLAPEAPGIIMTSAEVYFLLAEAALRGWNVGISADAAYKAGVSASMVQWGANMGDYLLSDKTAAPYVDAHNPVNNVLVGSQYLNNVSPKWDENDSKEVKLQKIITQKWIAGFPEGINAWAEQRRTGYPKIFPVVKNDSQGIIPSDLFVRRLGFSSEDKKSNEFFGTALTALGGPDNGATRLWWDKNTPNF